MTMKKMWFICILLWGTMLPTKAQTDSFTGYLFAYFEGRGEQQEHLRFAISDDAVNWHALNGNKPIVLSDTISESGGIRDPHILRGENGEYLIVATDMHTRDPKQGWNANPGIVLLRSNDLIRWTHSKINLSRDYPKHFGDAYWVWAPQTIYDRKARKYMIYFTLQRNDRKSLITYYAYANKNFTGFESEPKVLFRAEFGCIDNDIVEGPDGLWHMFYKGNTKDAAGKEIQNGIRQATSKSLRGPWKEGFDYIDAYADVKTGVEGSSVFKLNGQQKWVLMYDLYSSGRYEYQTSTDLTNFTSKPQSFNKDFFPRHGSVISLTEQEMNRVQEQWGYVGTYRFESNGNPIIRHLHTADPAVMVERDTLWLFTGHDENGPHKGYTMRDWLLFSTTDMEHWTQHPVPLTIHDFKWAKKGRAYAAHAVERHGKYYWFVSTDGCGIGVAVSDRITGPYKDAIGKPLLTRDDCFDSSHGWCCIDPAIFIDDDHTPYIIFGNRECYIAKLKDNMTELDGSVSRLYLGDKHPFTEAPWVHKYNGRYYLTYATGFPEKIAYAVSDSIMGPYETKGIISEIAGNSTTTHPAIIQYKGQWIFFSHNGALPDGDGVHRSVIAEPLHYDARGNIRPMPPTAEGVGNLDDRLSAYLMVYHEDRDHGLHMAVSQDGYTWTALNDDRPVIDGDTIAMQRGIRDPHIFRGPDGAFYLSMTDLHVFGQRDGKRTTEWERDGKLYGWGNNRGLVLMKSFDLIHWTRTNLDFTKLPPQEDMNWPEAGCVWAPETVFDEQAGQLMIHFTTRQGNGRNVIYYVYVNNDYNALIGRPRLLAEAPGRAYNIIDSDIIRVGDTYHLFYVSHEHTAMPKHATAKCITGPYTFDDTYRDGESQGHEAPNCWKRLDSDTYVVMYDNYRCKPMNFGFVETRDFFTYRPIGYFDAPYSPMKRTNFSEQKHGAVVPITRAELMRLQQFWKASR